MAAFATQDGHNNTELRLIPIASFSMQLDLTREVQPVATCPQSPFLRKPAVTDYHHTCTPTTHRCTVRVVRLL